MAGILGSHGLHAVPAVVAGSVAVASSAAACPWLWAAAGAEVANATAAGTVARTAASGAAAARVAARRPRGRAGPGSGAVGQVGRSGRSWLLAMVSPSEVGDRYRLVAAGSQVTGDQEQ